MKIEAEHLTLEYDNNLTIFSGVNFRVKSGDFIQISGPSGSGKSSLLRLLNRLQTPTSGQIYLKNKPIEEFDVPALRRQVAYLQQTPIMLAGSVKDNLLLSYQFRTLYTNPQPTNDQLYQILENFLLFPISLEDDAEKLSVGEKQRVSLIRLLLMKPKVLLCDEPTSALDLESKRVVETQIKRLNREKQVTIFWVTHTNFQLTDIQPRLFCLQNAILTEIDA